MSKKQFKISPKVWPKEYTFEEFKRLNPNINENVLINYYNKYLQEYAENYSRHIKYFNDNKKLLVDNLKKIKGQYNDVQYFVQMYYGNKWGTPAASDGIPPIFTPTNIEGLKNWYIGSEGISLSQTTPQRVTEWKDKIGGNHLLEGNGLEGTGGGEPIVTEDNAVSFPTGLAIHTNMGLEFKKPLSLGAFTMFFVLRLNTTSNNYHSLLRGSNGEVLYFFGNQNDMRFALTLASEDGEFTDSISLDQIDNDFKDGTKIIVMVTKDAVENAQVKLYINNVDSFPQGGGGGTDVLDENILFTPEIFGIYNGADRHLNGDVFEWGVFDRFIGESDRKQLYYYLGIKYDIPGYDGPSELKPYNWPHGGDTYPI